MRILILFTFIFTMNFCNAQYTLEWINSELPWILPEDMQFDDSSNALITGAIPDSTLAYNDFFLTKVDREGNIIWETSYDDGDSENPIKMSVDTEGIIVSGRKIYGGITTKFLPNGVFDWKILTSGDHLYNAINGQHEIYITNEFDYMKTDQSGIDIDTCDIYYLSYNSSQFLCLDQSGNILISGTKLISTENKWFVEKTDTNCNLLWQALFQADSFTYLNSNPDKYLIDLSMNTYLIGTAYIHNESCYLTIKFDSFGTVSWYRYYHTQLDDVRDAVVDKNGNVFVTGYSSDGITNGCLTIMYDSSGNQIWVNKKEKTPYPVGQKIRIGPDSSIIVLCYSSMDTLSFYSFLIRQLDYSGNEIWSDIFPGKPYLLAIDSSNNIYVCGTDLAKEHTVVRKYSHIAGIREVQQKINLNIFPNPLHTSASLEMPRSLNNKNNLGLLWCDLPGRVVKSEEISSQKNYRLDRAGIANGMYVLKLVSDNHIIATAKVVVQ